MRSLKFLAALAIPALFAACAKEELYDNYVDNNLQEMEEVVGTDLIGTDVSMVGMSGPQTKVHFGNGGAWHSDDVIGLGWVVTTGATTPQAPSVMPNNSYLYANHMFEWNEGTSEFVAKGNLYRGWHFAYYPWGYESAIAQKVFTVNPAQGPAKEGQSVLDTRKGQNLHLSNLQFLTNVSISNGDVNVTANVIDNQIQTPFHQYPVFGNIVVTTNPVAESAFATGGVLADLSIKSVKIALGDDDKVFAEKVNLRPQFIPVWDAEAEAEAEVAEGEWGPNQTALYNALYNTSEGVLGVVGERTSSVTTDVEKAEFVVSGADNHLITIVAPTTETINPADVKIDIVAGSGTFEIRYIDPTSLEEDEELSDAQRANNEAIEKLVAGYSVTVTPADPEAGTEASTTYGALTVPGRWLKIPVVLNPEDFTTEDQFNNIENHDQWVAAVDLVTKLQLKNPEFRITGRIDFENGIYMPTNTNLESLSVERTTRNAHYFNITGDIDGWPAKLSAPRVRVDIAEGVTVTNAHQIAVNEIYNYGSLYIPEGTNTSMNVLTGGNTVAIAVRNFGEIHLSRFAKVDRVKNDEETGEIFVEYGSVITPATGETLPGGKITYVAQKVDETQPERIIRLIATADQDQYAYVNNIVVGTGIELDLTKSETTGNTSGSNDIYAPEDPNEGTTTTSSVYGDLSGVDFSINGGTVKSTYLVSDVAPAVRNVTMNGGNVGPNVDITGKLAIEDGVNVVKAAAISAGVEVKAGSGVIDAKTITGGVTIESGNYTVIATAISGNVVAEGENYFTEVGAISGDLTLTNTTSRGCSLNGIAITGKTTLNGNFDLVNVTAANVEIKAGTVKLANNTITGTLTIGKDATVVIIGENDEFGAIVNNGKLTSFVDLYVEDVTLNAKSETVLTSNGEDWDRTIWYTGTYTHTNMTLKGTVEHANAALLMADLENALVAAASGEEATVTLKSDVVLTEPMILEPIATRTATPEVLKITVDLNGFDITAPLFAENQGVISEGNTDSYAFWVKEGVELTINGSGKVITQSADYGMCVWADGGKVIINGGEFYSPGRDNNCCDCIYAKNGGEVVINNGIFSHGGTNHPDGGGAVVNVHNTLVGKITVNGGTFRGDRIYEQGDIEAGTLIWNIQSEDVE